MDGRLVGCNLTLYVVVGRTAGFDNVSALPVFHFEDRGICEVPRQIVEHSQTREPRFHKLCLPLAQPVPVPGIHSRRISGRYRKPLRPASEATAILRFAGWAAGSPELVADVKCGRPQPCGWGLDH